MSIFSHGFNVTGLSTSFTFIPAGRRCCHPPLITRGSASDNPSDGRRPAQNPQLDTPQASKKTHNSIHSRSAYFARRPTEPRNCVCTVEHFDLKALEMKKSGVAGRRRPGRDSFPTTQRAPSLPAGHQSYAQLRRIGSNEDLILTEQRDHRSGGTSQIIADHSLSV